MEKRLSNFRIVLCTSFLFILFSALILQFFKVQIIEGDNWSLLAKRQHTFVVSEPARRGVFYSNDSLKVDHLQKPTPLVIDVTKFHLFINPSQIAPDLRSEVALKISDTLEGEVKAHRVRKELARRSQSRRLASGLSHQDREKLVTWWNGFAKKHKIPGNTLYFVKVYKRSYPFNKLLGPVLHTLREDRSNLASHGIPTGGLEMMLDRHLRGKAGKRRYLRSPRHSLDVGEIIESPEDGSDIYLTINHHLQMIAEEEIERAVKYAGAKGGWALLIDPHTGDIAALAQYPFFNLAKASSYYGDKTLVEATRLQSVTDCFEPGSPMKPITMTLALMANEEREALGEKPIFDPYAMVRSDCGVLPGRENRPMKDIGTHAFLNMPLAIQKSSNIYMARTVDKMVSCMGNQWYRDKLESVFGFGKKVGIELPCESAGFLPRFGKCYKSGHLEWSRPTPYSLAIGYNLLASSLQMGRAYSIIANGGYDVTPTLIKKIVRPGTGETLYERELDLEKRKQLIPTHISETIVKAMRGVTKQGGSATKANVRGYTEAGKTSTTEKLQGGSYSKKHHFSSFVGFAPVHNPRFVLMIGIDDPEYRFLPGVGRTHYGGQCAAPAFSRIMKRTLEYLGVPPDDPYGYVKGDPRRDYKKADWHNETEDLRKLYLEWNQKSRKR